MYLEYWKLSALPFESASDPAFFFGSEGHQEAFSRLRYLVAERRACGLLTGAYGCGKTVTVHALRQSLESEGYRFSVVTDPRVDAVGLLRLILHGFRAASPPPDKADVLLALEEVLKAAALDGRHSVVVIDEAHAIENDKVFDELRLLMNFETGSRGLLTLLLVGQPELRQWVQANHQFSQRVDLHCSLAKFSPQSTGEYIRHRLRVAGCAAPLFSEAAVRRIHEHSGGIPRWINRVCHLSLLEGFGRKARDISPEIVGAAIADIAS